jgi:hypothetical protein
VEEIKGAVRFVVKLDEEGGRWFKMVDEDMLQLHEDLEDLVNQWMNHQVENQIALEDRVIKLEMQVGQLTLERQLEKEATSAKSSQVSGATGKRGK